MKHTYKDYAQALADTALSHHTPAESKKIAERFLEIVEQNGDRKMLAKIVAHAELLYRRKSGTANVVLESARPLPKSARASIAKHFGSHDAVEEKINPSLIAGVRVTINGEQELDMSFAHKVNNLFKSWS
jgi:F0F1-type ATP synthase delta subunit